MYLTPSDLTSLRNRPHRTRLWLGIYKPNTVIEARINQADIAKGQRDITITLLTGDPVGVVDGMTCYVGVSQGTKEINRIRVRSATATQISVAENSINWQDGWFLTVVRFFEPWTVLPRIILDDDNNPIFYKDYDITYLDQNTYLDPVVCMGPHHAGFLEYGSAAPTGTHLIWYTSSGSYDPTYDGGVASYDWHFEGGNPTGSIVAHPGWVTYTGCGHFTTSLTITTDHGETFTGFRHIQVLTNPHETLIMPGCLPHTSWGFKNLDGDRDSGGYGARIWIREPTNPENIVDGALIVIFSEDWEGSTKTKVGANAENRDSVFFVGYVVDDTIEYDAIDSVVNFEVESPLLRTQDASAVFTAILEDKETTSTWNEMARLTIDRSTVHFLRWHSTLLAVADFRPTGDTLRIESQPFVGRNIYEIVNSMLETSLVALAVSDRQGKIWTEIDASVMPTGTSRQADNHMQDLIVLTRQDWRDEVRLMRMPNTDTAYLEMGGIAYSGYESGSVVTPLLAGAPGVAPEYHGGNQRLSGMVLENQNQLNEVCGHAWAKINALYPDLETPISGDYRFIDIAPQQRILLTIAAEDTFRRIAFEEKAFIPRSIIYTWNPELQALLMDLSLTEETYGYPADTVEIPTEPPWNETRLPPWEIEFPPIEVPPPWEPPVEPPPGEGDVVYICSTNRIGRTRNFNDEYPNWTRIDQSASGTFYWFELDPFDPANSAWLLSSRGLYRTFNLNSDPPTWSMYYTAGQFADLAIGNPGASTNMLNVVPHKQIVGSAVVTYVCDAGGPDDVRIGVTFDEGVSFTKLGDPTSTNQAHQVTTYLHEAAPGYSLIYLTTRYHPANFGFNRSMNGGLSWTEPAGVAWGFTSLCVPYQGNLAAMGMYACGILGQDDTNNFMYRSMDMGANWVYAGPSYDGKSWSSRRHDTRLQFGAEAFCFDHQNSANLYFIGQPNEPEATNYLQESVLFRKPGWYDDWEFVHWFKAPTAGLHMHPTNPLRLYLLGSFHTEDWRNSDAYIWGSIDAGVSWANKEGDWEDVMGTYGAPDSVGFNAQCIRPVWTI